MRGQSALLRNKAVTIHAAATALSTPAGAPAAELSLAAAGWLVGIHAPRGMRIALDSNGTGTVPGPVTVIAYDATDLKWRQIATLEGGATLSMTALKGFAWHLYDLPAWADALQLVAGGALTGGIAVTATAAPFEAEGGL